MELTPAVVGEIGRKQVIAMKERKERNRECWRKRKTSSECVAREGLPEEGAFDGDLNDEEGPPLCRSRRGIAKVLRWGLLCGFSNRKETSGAGSELGSESYVRQGRRGKRGYQAMQGHGLELDYTTNVMKVSRDLVAQFIF